LKPDICVHIVDLVIVLKKSRQEKSVGECKIKLWTDQNQFSTVVWSRQSDIIVVNGKCNAAIGLIPVIDCIP
jgi:hypothetical protein